MTLKKGFLRPHTLINKYSISPGIILGTAFSFGLYGLFYYLRESLRILTSQFDSQLLIELTPKENFYYNLFYGSIASIIGFYVFVKFVLENSINHKNIRVRLRQRHVLNEQAFFGWSFLYVFGRIAVIIGIWFLIIPMQFDVDFLHDFSLLLLLLPLVLFLNMWPTILKTIGRTGYKWLAYSFLYIITLSLVYANLNFIDYQKVNENLRQHSIELAYKVNVPMSQSHQHIERRSLVTNIYVLNDSTNNSYPTIFWNDTQTNINFKDINRYVSRERDKLLKSERYQLIANLHIDGKVQMRFVNDLKYELRKAGLRRIQYSTGVKHSKYPSYYPLFKYSGIQQSLYPRYYPEFEAFLDSAENLDFSKYSFRIPESEMCRILEVKRFNRIEIKVGDEKVFINDRSTSLAQLHSIIYKFIKKYSPNFIIIYSPDDAITYGKYIKYLDLIYYSIDKLRNEMSFELYNRPFEYWFSEEEAEAIRAKYPRNIVEWTPEEKRLIKLIKKARNVVYE